MDRASLTKSIKQKASSLFDLVGIAPAGPLPENQFYKEWLAKGHAAQMGYMEKSPEKRESVAALMPQAKSVISCGLNFNTDHPYSTECGDNTKGWIARYAWGDDYHEVIKERLEMLCSQIRTLTPVEPRMRSYVDTGPVLERNYAKHAGLGWVGKNNCLINQEIGSWVLIGEIITDIELEYDSLAQERCGTCTKCIDECPTDALRAPYELDSGLCISYLTIELKNEIPQELRTLTGAHVFGCDICQDVCPWNRRAGITDERAFVPREGLFNPELSALSTLSPEDFRALFKGSPIKRTKRRGLLRNVMVAMGNSEDKRFTPHVEQSLKDEEPLVRAHAAWALYRIQGSKARGALLEQKKVETDAKVLYEIDRVLKSAS